MDQARLNQFGAMCLLISDRLRETDERIVGRLSSAPAAIMTIGNYPGETIDALRGVLGISHSGTVRLIDRLVDDDLVDRTRDQNDTRRVQLSLTKAGAELFGDLKEARRAALAEILETYTDLNELLLHSSRFLGSLPMTRQSADSACRLCDEGVCLPDICPIEQSVAKSSTTGA